MYIVICRGFPHADEEGIAQTGSFEDLWVYCCPYTMLLIHAAGQRTRGDYVNNLALAISNWAAPGFAHQEQTLIAAREFQPNQMILGGSWRKHYL